MSDTDTVTTEQIVAGMLRENTGRHMLDSGGAYGRNWERNQERDFASEPEVTVSAEYGYLEVTINLYHFLTRACEYAPELDRTFREYADTCTCDAGNDAPSYDHGSDCPVGESYFALAASFPEHFAAQHPDAQVTTGYWPGEETRLNDPFTVNTYNHDSLLSQVIQYTVFHVEGAEGVEDGSYALVSVHGGADVRGGYTAPRVFRWSPDSGGEVSLTDDQRVYLGCTGSAPPQIETLEGFPDADTEYHRWNIYDGYHVTEAGDGNSLDFSQYGDPRRIETRDDWERHALCYLPDGTLLCPECGAPIEGYIF